MIKNKYNYIALLICIFCLLFLLNACASQQPQKFNQTAKKLKFKKITVNGKDFPMIYFTREVKKKYEHLHVYLGGDGIPWLDVMTYSEDPTPTNPLVLQLMNQDDVPSLYLGRPCYHGLSKTSPCNYFYWTDGRYSPKIINNMRDAIKQLVETYEVKKLTLIGFSGGGALATLLANKIPHTHAVVTVAGVLDTNAWIQLHHYSPLKGSLNPAEQPPLKQHIRQTHLVGDKDKNIPSSINSKFLNKQYSTEIIHFKQADHTCCWEEYWPKIVKKLKNHDKKLNK